MRKPLVVATLILFLTLVSFIADEPYVLASDDIFDKPVLVAG